jgi:hypothetical protein
VWLDACSMACRRGYVALGLYEFCAAVVYLVDTDATVWNLAM